ncbi:MAG: DUF3667 domain-containing protein [Rhizomicrobium sp.]
MTAASEICADCGAALRGPYCSQCGQKRLEDDDRRLGALLMDFLAEVFEWDSRWWRSLLALVFRPGRLSRAWLEGRRTRYVKPVTLFLLANFLYFFAPGISDFDLPLRDQMNHSHFGMTSEWVDRRIAARHAADPHYTLAGYETAYDARADSIGKIIIVLHVPFLALALLLLFWRTPYYYAEHFAVALHLFAFLLLFVQIFGWTLNVLGWIIDSSVRFDLGLRLILLATIVGYCAVALRRAYLCRWLYAVPAAGVAFAVLLATDLFVYRTVQFVVTFALT